MPWLGAMLAREDGPQRLELLPRRPFGLRDRRGHGAGVAALHQVALATRDHGGDARPVLFCGDTLFAGPLQSRLPIRRYAAVAGQGKHTVASSAVTSEAGGKGKLEVQLASVRINSGTFEVT